jgi:CRISPR/Cas system CSM-associated protein Csm5 (group 7 of RAMP superfamily)
MLLECIPAGARLTCTLTLDRGLLREFRSPAPFETLDEILADVAAFSGRVLDEEFRFFDGLRGAEALDQFYDETDANLRLGLGSGLPATTVHLNLPADLNLRVRDQVFRMRRESQFFPKSRKVVVEGERPVLPLGWVKVEVSEA